MRFIASPLGRFLDLDLSKARVSHKKAFSFLQVFLIFVFDNTNVTNFCTFLSKFSINFWFFSFVWF